MTATSKRNHYSISLNSYFRSFLCWGILPIFPSWSTISCLISYYQGEHVASFSVTFPCKRHHSQTKQHKKILWHQGQVFCRNRVKSNKTINLTCNLESIFWAETYKVVDGIHHDNSHNRSTQRQTTKKLDIISIHYPNLRFTLYKKAFSFHHNAVKILLKWISAPEARDSTKACRFFPPVFLQRSYERSR